MRTNFRALLHQYEATLNPKAKRAEKKNGSLFGDWFLGALQLLFLYLKISGSVSWSLWWVLAPTWSIPAGLLIFVLGYLLYQLITRK